jgi:hypothetical protein
MCALPSGTSPERMHLLIKGSGAYLFPHFKAEDIVVLTGISTSLTVDTLGFVEPILGHRAVKGYLRMEAMRIVSGSNRELPPCNRQMTKRKGASGESSQYSRQFRVPPPCCTNKTCPRMYQGKLSPHLCPGGILVPKIDCSSSTRRPKSNAERRDRRSKAVNGTVVVGLTTEEGSMI